MRCDSHHGPLGSDRWYVLLASGRDRRLFSAALSMTSRKATPALRAAVEVIDVESGIQTL